jgi:hypothetical protein
MAIARPFVHAPTDQLVEIFRQDSAQRSGLRFQRLTHGGTVHFVKRLLSFLIEGWKRGACFREPYEEPIQLASQGSSNPTMFDF